MRLFKDPAAPKGPATAAAIALLGEAERLGTRWRFPGTSPADTRE
jgi:hypothetical protein